MIVLGHVVHLLVSVCVNVWVYRRVARAACRHEQLEWGYLSIYTTVWCFIAVLMLSIVVSRLMYGVPRYI